MNAEIAKEGCDCCVFADSESLFSWSKADWVSHTWCLEGAAGSKWVRLQRNLSSNLLEQCSLTILTSAWSVSELSRINKSPLPAFASSTFFFAKAQSFRNLLWCQRARYLPLFYFILTHHGCLVLDPGIKPSGMIQFVLFFCRWWLNVLLCWDLQSCEAPLRQRNKDQKVDDLRPVEQCSTMSRNVFLLGACGTSSPNQAKRPPQPLFGICMTAIGRHQQLIVMRWGGGLPRRRALNPLSAPSVDFSKRTSQANVPGERLRRTGAQRLECKHARVTAAVDVFSWGGYFFFYLKRKRELCVRVDLQGELESDRIPPFLEPFVSNIP